MKTMVSNMTHVCLGDVAREIKQKVPAGQELPTVGLEHLDPGEVELAHWDEGVETTFTKAFSKGQVLFGRRRAYLRKAAVAPFDGICSGDITVIAPKDNVSPRLLPFIIQNDALFEHAVTNSAGSLSPRVKWQSLSQFEFELPSIAKQEELADILWTAQGTRSHYRQLLTACDDVVKSQFIEMFGSPIRGTAKFDMAKLGDLASLSSGATPKRDHPEYYGGDIPWVKTTEVAQGNVKSADEHITQAGLDNSSCRIIPAGTILMAMYGQGETRGKVAMLEIEAATNQACAAIECDSSKLNSLYALHHLRMCYGDLRSKSKGGNQKNLSLAMLKRYLIVWPPLTLQQEFADFAASVDKSKFAVQKALDELNATTKKILNQELGLGDV